MGFCSFSGAGQLDVFVECAVFLVNCATGSGTSVGSEDSCSSRSAKQSDVI